jgi:amino acid transporter
MLTDWILTLIWLPIGVSQTYGFQDASFFTEYYNGTGAPTGWNWLLSFLFTSGVLTGFDAAGHVAEETKNASVTAARGIFWSCFISAALGTPIIFLYLACSVREYVSLGASAPHLADFCCSPLQPDIDVMFSLDAPQPFVALYSLALGKGGQLVMVIIAVLGLWLNTVVCIIAASRLVFAIARDGVLPGSSWIGKVKENGQPKNAVIFTGCVASLLLCTILPSPVAFTSCKSLGCPDYLPGFAELYFMYAVVSAGAMPTIAAYALIPALRLFVTPGELKMAKWSNGRFSKPFCWIAMIWNLFLLATVISPYYFPVTADTFNYAPVIFGAVTLMGIAAYFVTPEEKWLPQRKIIEIADNEGWARHGLTSIEASVKAD